MTFFTNIFCEVKPDGTPGKPSFARISLGLVLCFCLGWVTAILKHNHFAAMPDMSGVIGFASAWGGLVYGGSKAISAFSRNSNG